MQVPIPSQLQWGQEALWVGVRVTALYHPSMLLCLQLLFRQFQEWIDSCHQWPTASCTGVMGMHGKVLSGTGGAFCITADGRMSGGGKQDHVWLEAFSAHLVCPTVSPTHTVKSSSGWQSKSTIQALQMRLTAQTALWQVKLMTTMAKPLRKLKTLLRWMLHFSRLWMVNVEFWQIISTLSRSMSEGVRVRIAQSVALEKFSGWWRGGPTYIISARTAMVSLKRC